MAAVRVRFAPSPTGWLHLGGARTALFNYLFARANEGALVLRVEDTDRERHVAGAERSFTDVLSWLGVRFSEGPNLGGHYGPYVQSQRLVLYQQYAAQLVKRDAAYPCFCSRQRLEELRFKGQRSGYDGRCRQLPQKTVQENLSMSLPHTIRMKVPDACSSASTVVCDQVYGSVEVRLRSMEDFVLLKSDGLPTYHLACVVDDHCMEISHVLRGEEWLLSTAKHLLLYAGMEWRPPQFAHLPLLLSQSGGKLSKRNEDASVEAYRARGYLPEAIVNFIALLGWSPAKNRGADVKGGAGSTVAEVLTMDDLITQFSLEGIKRAPVTVDKAKLDWTQKKQFRARLATPAGLQSLAGELKQHLQQKPEEEWEEEEAGLLSEWYLSRVLLCLEDRVPLLPDIWREASYFWEAPTLSRSSFEAVPLRDEVKRRVLLALHQAVSEGRGGCSREELPSLLRAVADSCELPYKHVMALCRCSLTGLQASPGVCELMEVLGRECVLQRLLNAANTLS